MSIENFKNPWAVGGEYYPKHLGGEQVLGGHVDLVLETSQRTSKWHGSPQQVKILEQKYVKFTKILKNLHRIPALYPNLIDELHKCTGMSKNQHLRDLNYNSGAEIFVFQHTNFDAAATNDSSFTLNSIALDNYEKLEGEELKFATAMWVVTLIHEEVHRGDRKTNGGFISGQWTRKIQRGKDQNNNPIYEYEKDFNSTIAKGSQFYEYSVFGHRGTDIEVIVFGCPGVITNQIGFDGRKTPWLISQYSETNINSAGSGSFNMSEWANDKNKNEQISDFKQRIGVDAAIQISNLFLQ